jgi:hypothetical protein
VKSYGFLAEMEVDAADHAIGMRNRQLGVAQLEWEPLAEGRLLGPWDMIWTMEGGRVEIEFLAPRYRMIDEWTGAVDSTGRPTGKNRFMSNMFFVMYPPVFREAKVTKALGDVRIARDREEVKAFVERNRVTLGAFEESHDPQYLKKWKEMLRKPELE